MFEKKTMSKTKKKKRKTKHKRKRRVRVSRPHRKAYGFRSASRLIFSFVNYSVLMLIMLHSFFLSLFLFFTTTKMVFYDAGFTTVI